jgi:RimJ/RimL family protein N-acetyltransferase
VEIATLTPSVQRHIGLQRFRRKIFYATEIARTLLRAGFEELGLQHIFAICDINHRASMCILEKAGLYRETTLYGYKAVKGRLWDAYRYAMTCNEWMRSRGLYRNRSSERR